MTKTSIKSMSTKEVEYIAKAIKVEATKAALTKAYTDNAEAISKAHEEFTAKAKVEADARRKAKAEKLAEKAKKIAEAEEKAKAEQEAKKNKGKGKGKKKEVSHETEENAPKTEEKVSHETSYNFTNANVISQDITKARRVMHIFNQLRHRIAYSINIDFTKAKLTVKDGAKLVARVNIRKSAYYLRTYTTGKEVITKQATLEDVLRACGYEI